MLCGGITQDADVASQKSKSQHSAFKPVKKRSDAASSKIGNAISQLQPVVTTTTMPGVTKPQHVVVTDSLNNQQQI